MRLASRVRAALAEVVAGLNGKGEPPLARGTRGGLLGAPAGFGGRHTEPSAALRALSEARMLASGSDAKAPASSQTIRGQRCLALTLAPKFLAGVPAGTAALPPED